MRLICIVLILIFCSLLAAKKMKLPQKPEDFFTDGYCKQTTAMTAESGSKGVRAFVDGKWRTYPLVRFPKSFIEWNVERRLEYVEIIRKLMKGETQKGPELAGPHNGMVATYGYAGQGSQFKLNNAVKGMGFLPKDSMIDSAIEKLKRTMDDPMPDKLDTLEGMYKDAENLFDMDRLVSLELYAEPKFLTQTYTNQMLNPVSTIVFLDIPSFKLKTIARLLDPNDPKLTPYEKKAVEYINLIHSYFHGKFDKDFIAVIYYVAEVYDNSPGRRDARGLKIVP
ncbi:MAG: hypothetical protein FJ041_00150 [Candidatus Cloacimonetes bacterium]|nr:hypothetical protein [Candidatus Cloacimonadota bacterium]